MQQRCVGDVYELEMGVWVGGWISFALTDIHSYMYYMLHVLICCGKLTNEFQGTANVWWLAQSGSHSLPLGQLWLNE